MPLANHILLRQNGRRLACVAMIAMLGAGAAVAEAQTSVTLSLVPSAPVDGPSDQLDVIVRLDASTPDGQSPAVLVGVQGILRFDKALLHPLADDPIQPIANGPFPVLNPGWVADAETGDLTFLVLVNDSFQGFTGAEADVARLRFRIQPGSLPCQAAGLVSFATIAGNSTLLGVLPGAPATLALSSIPAVSFDRIAPTLSVVPEIVSQAADAGRSDGAVIEQPVVTASDACDPSPVVSVRVTLPDGSSVSRWPAVFPIGRSDARWTARDASGNEAHAVQTVVVEDFQLLDCSIRIEGAFIADGPAFTRTVRISVLGSVQLVPIDFLPFDPTTWRLGIQIPVTESPPCVAAKSVDHSITDTAASDVLGTVYRAQLSLPQGDSNDDDLVDIIDFSMFVLAFGDTVGSNQPSNFNADEVVSNADFGPIAINYFRAGERCEGSLSAPARGRISVKELRRTGLGHLAAADLNGDGWVDQRDIDIFLASGAARAEIGG